MKNYQLILLSLLFISPSFAQEPTHTDKDLTAQLVGSWEHISSTFPSGIITKYRREFRLFEDGTGTCLNFAEVDTFYTNFEWEVQDSVIYLYLVTKSGEREKSDAQLISFLNDGSLEMNALMGDAELRKACLYKRRESAGEMAKY